MSLKTLLSLLVAALLASSVVVLGCSKDKSTNPPTTTLELNSGGLTNGQAYQHRFATAGTFNYHCSIHTTMHGGVVVDAGAPGTDSTVTISGFAFNPSVITVKPGQTVHWTNLDNTTHTVTSD